MSPGLGQLFDHTLLHVWEVVLWHIADLRLHKWRVDAISNHGTLNEALCERHDEWLFSNI